jgi:alkanesulfonate monooxygenase SsuD/methylene tetrahydromethanopterin reductase-like flavin-dependent oxidoreductase (luciferase family)
MSPKLSYLCLFENPTDEAGRALTRQFVLVREADRMGYDEIWVGEHHGDRAWPATASTALMGFMAGVTSHARIGVMACLPAYRDPAQLAADVSTLDLLSKGRFNLGVSRGLPYAAEFQPQMAGTIGSAQPGVMQDRALESLALVQKMLGASAAGSAARFDGRHFQAHGLSLVPPAAAAGVPTWMATTSPEVVSLAAQAGYGLMAGATSTPDRLRSLIATYREAAPGGDPRMVLARFAFPAETREEAREAARPYLEAFVQRMKVLGVQPHPGETVTFDVEALIDQSLIGSYQEVADKITQIQDEIGVHSVAVIPTSAQFDTVKRVLADMVDEVRPLLPDY